MEQKYIKTHEFIKNRWKDAVRENKEGEYALPYPFVPPCVTGLFKCIFYWDTFYTNHGMILDGKIQYALDNVNNLLYLLDKYGYVPNSNSYPGLKNTQPPYLHFMVKDIYEVTHDDEWLKKAYFSLKKEYNYWMSERITPIGLNRYFHSVDTDQENIAFYDYVATRINLDKNASREDKIRIGSSLWCDGEGGLDFSPRFKFDGTDMVEVDLNSILYAMEKNLALWAKKFEPDQEQYFISQSNKRLELINFYLLNKEDGLYYDYNYVKKEIEQTEIKFTGQFFPYIVGISKDKEACKRLLKEIEFEFGVASTTPYDDSILKFQAAYPYSWPYDNGITFWALTTLGLEKEAQSVGFKYLNQCADSFIETGHLWETYNAIEHGVARKDEYANNEMLGWTAGIYQWIYYYLLGEKR